MPKRNPHSQGYTLFELIIVIGIIGVLSVAALTGIIKSQSILKFRGAVKDTANIIREARSAALSNKKLTEIKSPSQYGAYIETNGTITIFADMLGEGEYNMGEEFNTYTLPDTYTYEFLNLDPASPSEITLFYEPTTAKFSMNEKLAANEMYAAIKIYEGTKDAPTRESYIVLFKNAGSPENFTSIKEIPGENQ